MRGCPQVRVLATSREPLGLAGRRCGACPRWPCRPRRAERLERLTQYEAVRLFVERARPARPSFALTAPTRRRVAEICCAAGRHPAGHRAGGGAGARAWAWSEIARAAGRPLPAARRAAAATALPRQQTLRATMDWSYDLLRRGRERSAAPAVRLRRRLDAGGGGGGLRGRGHRGGGGAGPAGGAGGQVAGAWPRSAAGGRRGALPAAGDGAPVRRRAAGSVRRGRGRAGPARRPSIWRWPRRPRRTCSGRNRRPGSPGWRPSRITCGRRCAGTWSRAPHRRACGCAGH